MPARRAARSRPESVADVAASFQEAVVDVLVAKTRQALARTGLRRLGVGGGVAANARFRERIAAMADEVGVELFIPPLSLCTDNAAMAGIALAEARRRTGRRPRHRRHTRAGPTVALRPVSRNRRPVAGGVASMSSRSWA